MSHWLLVSLFMALVVVVRPATAGPITGKYWYLGVGNNQAVSEGQDLFDALKDFKPWKDLPKRQVRIRQNAGGKQILSDLKFFHDNVKDGDTFVFFYGGHSSQINDRDGDERDRKDELLGLFGELQDFASDDDLASENAFGSFPKCSTLIIIFKTCLAGGFIDGTNDLVRQAIKDKQNILFMGVTGPVELCGPQHEGFLNDIIRALEEGQKDDKQTHAKEWASIMTKFWKERGFDLAVSDNLDTKHDRTVANAVPKPSTLLLLGIVLGISFLIMLGYRWRRRSANEKMESTR